MSQTRLTKQTKERFSTILVQQLVFRNLKNHVCVCFLVLLDAGAERGVAVVLGGGLGFPSLQGTHAVCGVIRLANQRPGHTDMYGAIINFDTVSINVK